MLLGLLGYFLVQSVNFKLLKSFINWPLITKLKFIELRKGEVFTTNPNIQNYK